ncbi:MAG: TRAP transporter small permease subunit [Rubrivivax sp.]|nr:TRAP transporter small permease subunit [Rubrivivax sp.]MBK7261335.1 TRAP transporter small permease subunit [Rubrivivax sp.]MBK8529606.1 TRAP transporter small permease subunit [Rubrivivax sp.]
MSSSGGAGPDPLLALAQRWSVAGALAGGVLILAAAVLVSVDVTLRKLANVTLGGADELSGYALAIGSTWSFAFVLLNRGNVRIDALYQRLPRAGAALCDVLAVVALLAFGGVVAWYGWGVVAQSWASNSHSNSALAVPLVVPQVLWWLGYVWFMACGLLLLARALGHWVARDWDALNGLVGARSVADEAEEELANALAAAQSAQRGAPR